MGRKNIVKSFKMFDEEDISVNAQSATTNIETLDKASIHVMWSGTAPLGVLTVETRNGTNDVWHVLDMGGDIAISGSPGEHCLVFNELPFTDIRLQYTSTSGTGTMDAVITSKTVGA